MSGILRLSNKFDEYRINNLFIDCEAKCGEKSFKCHRIVLSNFSLYFKDLFKETPANQKLTTLDIPAEFENEFEDLFLFFYQHEITISTENVIPILAFAVKYKVKHLDAMARDQFSRYVEKESNSVLDYSKKLLKFEVNDPESNQVVAPTIAKNYKSYNREILLSSITPICLAEILQSDALKDDKVYTIDYKLSLIDDYHEKHPITDPEVRKTISLLFDFNPQTNETAYKYIINHRCLWAPDELTKELYKIAIRNRLNITNQYKEYQSTRNEDKSRWIDFQWCSKIYNSDISSKDEQIEAVLFARTLGGFIERVNPLDFGLLQCESDNPLGSFGESIHKCPYKPSGIFMDDDSYYMAQGYPKVTICLGNNCGFKISKIEIQPISENECENKVKKCPAKLSDKQTNKIEIQPLSENESENKAKNQPAKPSDMQSNLIQIRAGIPEQLTVTLLDKDGKEIGESQELKPETISTYKFVFNANYENPVEANKIRIAMSQKNKSGESILRLNLVSIYGQFI